MIRRARSGGAAGYILVPVVMILSLVAAVAFMVNRQDPDGLDSLNSDQARYLAQAGLNHARRQLNENTCGDSFSIPDMEFGSGSYQADVTVQGSAFNDYTLSADRDAWIKESSPDESHGPDQLLSVKNADGDHMNALYRFNISTVPSGATVASAVASFYAESNDDGGPRNIHRVTADWDQINATWNSIGNQYDAEVIAIIPSAADPGWVEVNLTSLVQSWVNGAEPNYGMVIVATSDGNESKFTSKEGPSEERPKLDISTGDGVLSPVVITATGTVPQVGTQLGSISHTVTRANVPAYQPAATHNLRPGPGIEDTFVTYGTSRALNFGASTALAVEGNNKRNTLLRFDLNALPPEARVASATLGLYLEGGAFANNGTLDVHRLARDWVEGVEISAQPAPGEGATFDDYDGTNGWTGSGGDYDADVVDSVTVADLDPGWYEWDVTQPVLSWLAGEANYGLLLRNSNSAASVAFTSGDNPDRTVSPRLTLTLACECGVACNLPQGFALVLMVVGNSQSVAASDADLKSLLESWGYVVKLLDDNATQAEFDADLITYDVVYVTESASSAIVDDKLTHKAIGVLNAEGLLNDELGISSNNSVAVGSDVLVMDGSHYITQVFSVHPLEIYAARMSAQSATGTPAADLQTLATWSGGSGSLAVLDVGESRYGGGVSAGRRVALPWHAIRWDQVNNNGRLMLHRALQWGAFQTACEGTFADAFDTEEYDNSSGTLNWLANVWQEIGESDGPTSGDVRARNDKNRSGLRIKGKKGNGKGGRGAMREADLAGATSVILTYAYQREKLDDPNDYAIVEISANGAAGPWTELTRHWGPDEDDEFVPVMFDITEHISANTRIRMLNSPDLGDDFEVWFDDVQFQCSL